MSSKRTELLLCCSEDSRDSGTVDEGESRKLNHLPHHIDYLWCLWLCHLNTQRCVSSESSTTVVKGCVHTVQTSKTFRVSVATLYLFIFYTDNPTSPTMDLGVISNDMIIGLRQAVLAVQVVLNGVVEGFME